MYRRLDTVHRNVRRSFPHRTTIELPGSWRERIKNDLSLHGGNQSIPLTALLRQPKSPKPRPAHLAHDAITTSNSNLLAASCQQLPARSGVPPPEGRGRPDREPLLRRRRLLRVALVPQGVPPRGLEGERLRPPRPPAVHTLHPVRVRLGMLEKGTSRYKMYLHRG